ncbi:MAG: glycosyltransferase family 4 protein, partial [Clostridium sp.]|nr:glycosyltransferase family 4 protein [Clostridium sp.]
IVTVSYADKSLLEEKKVTNMIQVIYNGVEQQTVQSSDEDEVIAQIASYRDKGYKVIGCIGSVCNRKNQRLLIEAVSKVKRDILIVLIGEVDESSDIKEVVAKYEDRVNVEFFGYKKDASQYIRCFDYLCLPSQSEGMPIVIMEAFKEKTPVICSDIKCHQELITEGQEGYLFKNNDALSLSQVIESAIKTEQTNVIVEKAYKKYEALFMKDECMRKYDELYNTMINGSASC